jgi:hypothetical protein
MALCMGTAKAIAILSLVASRKDGARDRLIEREPIKDREMTSFACAVVAAFLLSLRFNTLLLL